MPNMPSDMDAEDENIDESIESSQHAGELNLDMTA